MQETAVATWSSAGTPPREGWSVLTLRALLGSRSLAAATLGGVAAYFLVLFLLGLPIHRCPFHALTGHPCPGCGLSRAGLLLLKGEWSAMWRMHPFAPYFAAWAVLLAGAALLPRPWRERWAAGWTALEARTRFHAALLAAFAVFGVARLLWSIARPV